MLLETEYYRKVCWLKANPGKALRIQETVRERLAARGCPAEKIPPFSLMPLLLDDRELKKIRYAAEVLYYAIQKTIEASFKSPHIRKYFSYEELPREWLEKPPGYAKNAVFVRMDAIFDGRSLRFFEFNTDGLAGQAWGDAFNSTVSEHPFYQPLVSSPGNDACRAFMRKSAAAVRSLYAEFAPKAQELPKVAILDSKNSPTEQEAQFLLEGLRSQGLDALKADPRSFTIKDQKAYVHDAKIDVVCRCMMAREFLKHQDKLKGFLDGYLNGAFCMINPFRSVYGSERVTLALMTMPEFHHLYDAEEVAAIRRHLPWSRQLSEAKTSGPGGKEVAMGEFLKKSRERMLLRPTWGADVKDVFLGRDTPEADWDRIVDERLGNKDWLAQEHVPAPQTPMPVVEDKKGLVRRRQFAIQVFVTNGEFSGLTARCTDGPPVKSQEGTLVPVIPCSL